MTEANPAPAATQHPIVPSPYPSGLFRLAISSREPRPRPGWRRPASRAPARPCPTQPAPYRPPVTAFTLLLPGGLFLRPFKLATPPFPFVVESGLSFRSLIDGARGRLLPLWAFRLAGGFRWSSAAKIGGQLGMFAERSIRSNRAPENDAGLCHGRCNDVRIVALLRRALVEEIAVCAPRFQSGFHGGSGHRQIEEAQRGLVGLAGTAKSFMSAGSTKPSGSNRDRKSRRNRTPLPPSTIHDLVAQGPSPD